MKLEDIKNPINQFATAAKRIGISNEEISVAVAEFVKVRGPIGTGKYQCSCNNWGPRWIEDSLDGCCPGCFQWALDHHYEVPTSKLDPNRVTREMIEENTWGIDADKVREMNHKKHAFDGLENVAAGNDPKDGAGIKRDPDVPSFFHNLDWIPEDK